MKKLRNYFIGHYLTNPDVFEKARALMLYQFALVFCVTFILPFITDYMLGLKKAVVLHGIDAATLWVFPFILKYSKTLDWVINLFFTICFLSAVGAYMMLSPMKIDIIAISWTSFFLVLSALLQRGIARILYCCFFGWLPLVYVMINIQLKGALTWNWILQAGAEDPPMFLVFIPIVLSAYAIWSHTYTIQKAKETITEQKAIIEEKNKDITDSIVYARRIQRSLLPHDKYIARTLERLKKK